MKVNLEVTDKINFTYVDKTGKELKFTLSIWEIETSKGGFNENVKKLLKENKMSRIVSITREMES